MFHVKQVEYSVEATCGLLEFLSQQMPDSSRTKVKELLAHSVCVDGRRVSQFNYPLQPGMKVTIEKVGYKERLKPRELDIVFEDEHLFVVNKHEGLLSYSKKGTDMTVSVDYPPMLQCPYCARVGLGYFGFDGSVQVEASVATV